MTEQEIIDFLKKNKEKGVGYGFMPDEVQDWVEIHPSTWFKVFFCIEKKNGWKQVTNANTVFDESDIIRLPIDFELPSEKIKGEWVEFDIDKNGFFSVSHLTDDADMCTKILLWHQWSQFLDYCWDYEKLCFKNGLEFTTFGGWYYGNANEPIPRFHMHPCVVPDDVCGIVYTSYCVGDKNIKGMIPTKIRFWRIKND